MTPAYCLEFLDHSIRKRNPESTGLLEFRDRAQSLGRPKGLECTGHSTGEKTAAQIGSEQAPQTCRGFDIEKGLHYLLQSPRYLSTLPTQGSLRERECIAVLGLNMATLGFKSGVERGQDSHQFFPTKFYFPLVNCIPQHALHDCYKILSIIKI